MRILTVALTGVLLAVSAPIAQAASFEDQKVVGASARQMALSRRYVELMQGDQLEQLIRTSIEQQAEADTSLEGLSDEDRRFTIDLAGDVVAEVMPEMLDRLVPVYARTFSEAELEALVSFYDTELGRSIVTKTLTSMPEANEAMMAVIPKMMEKMAARVCARYGCEEGEAETFTGGASAPPARRK